MSQVTQRVLVAVLVMTARRRYVERGAHDLATPVHRSEAEADAVAVGDLD